MEFYIFPKRRDEGLGYTRATWIAEINGETYGYTTTFSDDIEYIPKFIEWWKEESLKLYRDLRAEAERGNDISYAKMSRETAIDMGVHPNKYPNCWREAVI